MPPMPQFVTNTLERMFFSPAVVSEVVPLSGHFRLIEIEGQALKNITWVPGQKIQFHLGNLVNRTYTPVEWNPIKGTARFLAFLHGNGPGSEWASSLKQGSACQFFGPRSSLNFADSKGESIFFGDETSIGAALAHNQSCKEPSRNAYVFEISSLAESNEVVHRLGLSQAKLIAKVPGETHLVDVEKEIAAATQAAVGPWWIFTGNAQSIQTIRKTLRARRISPSHLSTKAYWAYGKKGLD